MTIDTITDSTMYGYCPTAISHAQDAGHEILGVCVTGPLDEDEAYSSDDVDIELTRRLGRECTTYGEGETDEDGNTTTPIIAV